MVETKMSSVWQKLESKAGYPYYANSEAGIESPDHPQFAGLLESLQQYGQVKYEAYRAAFKTYELQRKLEVDSIGASMGVLARHCLSISESSLTLEPCELEAVLADVYFAARQRCTTNTTDDTQPQLLLNLIVNMYHPERQFPIRVQSVKVLLILLSNATCEEKWSALVDTCADHNGCVSARRLTALLDLLARAAEFLGEDTLGRQRVQADVDSCFAKSAGMMGMSVRSVVSWALCADGSAHTRWLLALDRVRSSRLITQPVSSAICSACRDSLFQMLRFRCDKCCNAVVCERCYLYDKDLTLVLAGHKKTHTLHEIVEGEVPPSECLSGFMKDVKKFFSCSRHCTKKKTRSRSDSTRINKTEVDTRQIDNCKPCKGAMFTSTVGKAAGGRGSNPQALLQDIIAQLESQNKALKDLSGQLEGGEGAVDDKLRRKVDSHWGQIATQINRLKILKDNLSTSCEELSAPSRNPSDDNRLQAFDLFSPIPMLQEEAECKSDKMKTQPRLLSLDSGISDASKPSEDSQHLMTMSGDAIKPIVVHATSDSISTVSMNDISSWFGNGTDTESIAERKRQSSMLKKTDVPDGKLRSNSLCVTEQRYDEDLRTVATSNHKMKELNADLDTVLDRLQKILTNNFVLDDSCFDNTQLRETANEMEGLLGTLIRGVEQRTSHSRVQHTSSV